MKPEVFDLQANTISIRLEEEGEGEEEEDGDLTPKVCQLDSVREVDECWSSISWSSLYDRGTDSSLSWADDVRSASQARLELRTEIFSIFRNMRRKQQR